MEKIDVTSQYEPYYNTISAAANCVKSGARGKLASSLSDYITALGSFSFSSWQDEAATATKATLNDVIAELNVKLNSIEGTFKAGEQAIVYLQQVLQMLKQNETSYNRLVDMWKQAKAQYDSEPDYINEYSTRGNKKVKTGTRANPNKTNLKNLINEIEEQAKKIMDEIEKNIKEIENYIKLIDSCDSASLSDAAIAIPTITSGVITVDFDSLMAKYPTEEVEAATYSFLERAGASLVTFGAASVSGASNIVDGAVNVVGVVAGGLGALGAIFTEATVAEGFEAWNFGSRVDLSAAVDDFYFSTEFANASYIDENGYHAIQTGTEAAIILTLGGVAYQQLAGTALVPLTGGTTAQSASTALQVVSKPTSQELVNYVANLGATTGTSGKVLGNGLACLISNGTQTAIYGKNGDLIVEGVEAVTNFLSNNPSLLI